MNAKLDNEIQDAFVAEAGEHARRLGVLLVSLEAAPADRPLLDAVFRSFHAIKGGAAFLPLDPVVRLCHQAEDLLNAARSRGLLLRSPEIDALLDAVDALDAMIEALDAGRPVAAPVPALLARLRPPVVAVASEAAPAAPRDGRPAVDDDEFEAMLDGLYGGKAPGFAPAAPAQGPVAVAGPLRAPFDSSGPLDPRLRGDDAGVVERGDDAGAVERAHDAGAVARGDDAGTAARGDGRHKGERREDGRREDGERSATPGAVSVPSRAAMVRVEAARLDALVDRVEELQSVRRRLHVLAGRDATLAAISGELDHVAAEVQAAVLALRMQPVARLFERYPRVVRELARKLGKEVELVLAGSATDLDRGVADALGEPLVHLLRNALDHGIATPAERAQAGKPRRGTIELAAEQRGGGIVIRVRDDGRGMDPEALRRRAVALGFVTADAAAELTAADCRALVFRPGFSTSDVASETSGRGVGMDAVRTCVEELGGSVRVDSVRGEGTTVEMEIPLALSVLRVQVVRAGTQLYALPAADVEDGFALDAAQVESSAAGCVLRLDGRALPLANLSAWTAPGAAAGRQVVVLRHGLMRVACLVDAIFPREDVIVRALGPLLAGVPGIAGGAVTGDGALALVVAPAGLVDASGALLPDLKMKA